MCNYSIKMQIMKIISPLFSLSGTKCNANKRKLQNHVLEVEKNGLQRPKQTPPSGYC